MPLATASESALILRANRDAHLARWGTDPCAGVTAGRSGGVGKSTGFSPTTASDPLRLLVPGGAWCPVHSADRPLEEAREWLASSRHGLGALEAICVIGAGAGWVVDAAEERHDAIRVLVFEPEPACAEAMFERRDLRALIQAGRLMVLSGPAFDGAATAWRLFGRIAV